MEKDTAIEELRKSIFLLEIKHADEGRILKEQFKETYESLKPANLIKTTLKELETTSNLKKDILDITISLAARYLSKKTILSTPESPLKKIIITLLEMGAAKIISKRNIAKDQNI